MMAPFLPAEQSETLPPRKRGLAGWVLSRLFVTGEWQIEAIRRAPSKIVQHQHTFTLCQRGGSSLDEDAVLFWDFNHIYTGLGKSPFPRLRELYLRHELYRATEQPFGIEHLPTPVTCSKLWINGININIVNFSNTEKCEFRLLLL